MGFMWLGLENDSEKHEFAFMVMSAGHELCSLRKYRTSMEEGCNTRVRVVCGWEYMEMQPLLLFLSFSVFWCLI